MPLLQKPKHPFILSLHPENIPKQLKDINQWVGWIVGKQKPNGKYDKIPVNIRAKPCNAHVSANWMSYQTAIHGYDKGFFSGIGFVLNGEPVKTEHGELTYLVGIDLDRCVHINNAGNYEVSSEVEEVWQLLGCPYKEISPSGTGVRMFVYSTQKIESANADGHEMYVEKRYLTLTGNGQGKIIDATEGVLLLHKKWFPKKHLKSKANKDNYRLPIANNSVSETENKIRSALASISSDISYDDWRDIIWAIKSSGLDSAETFARNWSEASPERYTEEGFNNVWDSFDQNRGITLGTLFFHAQQAGWHDKTFHSQYSDEGDILNGRLYADEYRGKHKFIFETGELLMYTNIGWVHAPPGEAEISAKAIVKKLKSDAMKAFKKDPNGTDAKRKLSHAAKSSLEPRVRAMISMARSEPNMTARLSEFDADPYLLGLQNGILDLRTSLLLQSSPKNLVSMRTNVSFAQGARCPQWMHFLDTVQPDKATQRLLQQIVGTFLAGGSGLQKMIIMYGSGANGKSTFIEVVSWLLGEYGLRIPTEMLMHHQRSPQGPSPDIVSLKGRRMAYCNEVEEGRRIDEARVKELTGGDSLTGRSPYAKHAIVFNPTHKLVMVGNHKPEIHDMSNGMWRRILLIPFDVTISADKQNTTLLETLKTEGSGILAWAIAGYRDYMLNGLLIPKSIEAATDGYKQDEDLIGEWLDECCVIAPGAKSPIGVSYKAYRQWAINRGHFPLAQSRLTRRLKDRGFERDAGKRHYLGFEPTREVLLAYVQNY